jgi:DNA-directed RNA polymerase specialized sigma24 family protein
MDAYVHIDLLQCEALIAGVLRRDDRSWKRLIEHLWPWLFKIVAGNRAMGLLARSDDEVHNVLTKIVEKLGKDHGRALSLYGAWREQHTDKSFDDWLRIVASNVVRDHVRESMVDAAAYEEPGVKRLLNEFATCPALTELAGLSVRPPMTNAQTARELFEFAEKKLRQDQHRALVLWVEGASHPEIGAELGLPSEEEAAKLVRSAIAVLRRAFGAE